MALSINEEGEEFYEAEGGAVSDKSPATYRFVLMVFCSLTKNRWKRGKFKKSKKILVGKKSSSFFLVLFYVFSFCE